jgi:hypothetical protein
MLVPVNLSSMLLVSRIMLLYVCSVQKLVAMFIKVLTSFCLKFCFAYVFKKHDIRLFDNLMTT